MARAGALWTHVLSKPLVDVVRRRKHSSRAPASLPRRRANAWHQHTWTWEIALAGKNHELSRPTFSPARTGRSLFVGYFAAFRADPRARACRPARERPPASARPRSDRLRHLWSARESRPARSHEPEVRPPTATLANSPQPLPSQRGSSKSDARPAAPGGCWRRTRARAPRRGVSRVRGHRARARARSDRTGAPFARPGGWNRPRSAAALFARNFPPIVASFFPPSVAAPSVATDAAAHPLPSTLAYRAGESVSLPGSALASPLDAGDANARVSGRPISANRASRCPPSPPPARGPAQHLSLIHI